MVSPRSRAGEERYGVAAGHTPARPGYGDVVTGGTAPPRGTVWPAS